MEAKSVYRLYEYFSEEYSGSKDVRISPYSKNKFLIDHFIKVITECYPKNSSFGITFLWNYFIFQYNSWTNLEGLAKEDPIPPLNFVIGNKSITKWLEVVKNKDISYKYFAKINLLKRYPTLKLAYIEKLLGEVPLKRSKGQEVDSFKYEESQRELFFNKEGGFNNCYYHTSLCNNKSIFCLKCISKDLCQKLKNRML